MKKILIYTPVFILLFACNRGELDRAKQSNDSLSSLVMERNATINEFLVSFSDVERNLDSVAARQHIISESADKPGELKPNQKDRINREIDAINKLMIDNRNKLISLNRKLKNSAGKNIELENAVASLNNLLNKKDIELKELNEKLNTLNAQVAQLETSVGSLTEANTTQAQRITEETTLLHTAYYVVGKSNDLKEAKIIDKKGGLLGIGRTSRLTNDFDNSKFIRIDYTLTNQIPVNSSMKIITVHPSKSFVLDNDSKDKDLVKNIQITDPELFWSVSKYLVVVKN